MKIKTKIGLLREKTIRRWTRILRLLQSLETLSVFRSKSGYCLVGSFICIPFGVMPLRGETSRRKQFCPSAPVKHNKPLRLTGKNNLDSPAAVVFINSGGCSQTKKTRLFLFRN